MYDIGIVGGGPAAWSCGMTARMRNLSACIMMSGDGESWLQRADRIDNYPGLANVSGKEMLRLFEEQGKSMGADQIKGTVRQIMPMGTHFMLLCGNEVVEAKTIVLAMGAGRPKALPGEEELVGQGVSYCGTCDGMFYKGKEVIVLASGEQ
ncbi:MAG: NAD(P)/FAD-dependent oxidoreductase [Clostridiales bacterium]|nr:NAD(P)/FAD-dependent oxidoreductase [Clostridiales bacterium]